MPYNSVPDIIGIMEVILRSINQSSLIYIYLQIFGSFLYPIALALQLPVYLYIIVLEKAEKIREMMGMHGLFSLVIFFG